MSDKYYSDKMKQPHKESEQQPLSTGSVFSALLMTVVICGIGFGLKHLHEYVPIDKGILDIISVVVLFGGGLLLVSGSVFVGFLPLKLARDGRTKMALDLALLNASIMGRLSPLSMETVGLRITVANVARSHAKFQLAETFSRKAIDGVHEFARALEEFKQRRQLSGKGTTSVATQFFRNDAFKEAEAGLLLGWSLWDQGKFDEAQTVAERSVKSMKDAIDLETQPQKTWDKSGPKGIKAVLDFDLTEHMAKQSADFTVKGAMPFNYVWLSNTFDLLSQITAKKGEADSSKRYIKESLAALEAGEQCDSVHMVTHLHNKSCALLMLGDARAAKAESEKAMQLAEKYKPSKGLVSSIHTVLGESSRRLGMKSEAQKHLNTALSAREKLLPKDHPEVAEVQHYLARLYKDMGKRTDAKKMFEKCIETTLNSLPQTHIDVVERKREMAQV